MPKRRPKKPSDVGDIFDDDRFDQAMQSATAPTEPPVATAITSSGPAPAPQSRPDPHKVVSMPERAAHADAAAEPKTKKPNAWQTVSVEPQKAPESQSAVARPPKPAAPETPQEEAISAHEPHVTLKLRVPQGMRADFKRFTAELGGVLGVTVDDSNIGRPLIEHFLNEQRDRILEVARSERSRLKRPANGDAVGMAEFDEAIGRVFAQARKRKRRSTGDSE